MIPWMWTIAVRRPVARSRARGGPLVDLEERVVHLAVLGGQAHEPPVNGHRSRSLFRGWGADHGGTIPAWP